MTIKELTCKACGALFLSSVLLLGGCNNTGEKDYSSYKVNMEDEDQQFSYTMGVVYSKQLQQANIELDKDAFMKAMYDVMNGNDSVLTEQQIQTNFQAGLERARTKANEAANAESEAYLAENAKKEGVQVTNSGLQYEVLQEGSGQKPSGPEEVVKVHYTGKLLDGTVFDSSVERGQPATFALNRVIPGWTEGVQMMPVGSKYRFTIPAVLAYGENGSPPKIPGNSTLVFDVELLEIVQPEAPIDGEE